MTIEYWMLLTNDIFMLETKFHIYLTLVIGLKPALEANFRVCDMS